MNARDVFRKALVEVTYWSGRALSKLPDFLARWWYPLYNRTMILSSDLDEKWNTGRWTTARSDNV